MKKFLLPVAAIITGLAASAQVPRHVLFEHFTQASCGPCASQNPGFKTSILDANPSKVKHIAYHTSWPGTDPMYNFNSGANGARTSFYSVSGVPSITLMGNKKTGAPGNFTQADVDNTWNASSPIKMEVSEVDNGTNRDVTVKITSLGTPPAGTYNLYVAVIERNVNYTSPPGSNGEKYFPNVFRAMLTGGAQTLPGSGGNANGTSVSLPAQGNTITMGPYNYLESWKVFNANEMAAVAWIQNTSTKEIIQCGATFDAPANGTMSLPAAVVANVNASTAHNFDFNTSNTGSASENFSYTLTTNAPGNWTGGFVINGQNYTNSASLSIPAGTTYSVQINVTPGSTPAVGKYTLTMQSTTNPSSPANVTEVYVISGVTDLIVSNAAGQGDNTGTGLDFESQYVAGIQSASNTTYGATDDNVLLKALQNNAMGPIKYIYWNVAWTFPTFNSDALVNELTTFLNNGGCLFMAGQDIGWDIHDANGNGTPAQKTFYTNFLGAAYVGDGAATNTPITANAGDAIYGTAGSIALSNSVYGTSNFFPDDINTAGTGTAIFYYNGNSSKKGGVRNTNGTFKTVYLAPGVEQITSVANKNTVLKIAHDWFHGLSTGIEYENAMQALSLGQNFPNPAVDYTYIPLPELDKDALLEVVDALGRVVITQSVSKDISVVKVNTSDLKDGMYSYRLNDGKVAGAGKPLQVVK